MPELAPVFIDEPVPPIEPAPTDPDPIEELADDTFADALEAPVPEPPSTPLDEPAVPVDDDALEALLPLPAVALLLPVPPPLLAPEPLVELDPLVELAPPSTPPAELLPMAPLPEDPRPALAPLLDIDREDDCPPDSVPEPLEPDASLPLELPDEALPAPPADDEPPLVLPLDELPLDELPFDALEESPPDEPDEPPELEPPELEPPLVPPEPPLPPPVEP